MGRCSGLMECFSGPTIHGRASSYSATILGARIHQLPVPRVANASLHTNLLVVSPLKSGQEQDKPFSRHHSLFSPSGARKAAHTPSRWSSRYVRYMYIVHTTGISTAHARARDTRTQDRPQ